MQWLKYIIVVTLGTCLVLPFAGTWSWLRHEQVQVRRLVKKQIIAGMDKEDLTVLKFSLGQAEGLDWHHSEEFRYGDVMYDIVDREICADSVTFWCWKDMKETALKQQAAMLARSFGHNAPVSHAPGQYLINFIKNVFCHLQEDSSHQPCLAIAEPESGCACEHSIAGTAPPTPPPDIV